jgi:AcrR family transcriptional regulator
VTEQVLHLVDDSPAGLLPPTPELSASKRKVLEACVSVFAERGYGGSSVRDIASAAGMQSGNLYNHFDSKDSMLAAIASIGLQHHLRVVTDAVLDAGASAADQLAAAIRATVMTVAGYPQMSSVLVHEQAHLPTDVLAPTQALSAQLVEISHKILIRGSASGQFHIDDLEMSLSALLGMSIDIARWFPFQPYGPRTAAEVADHYVVLALRLVGATDPSGHDTA